MSYLFKDTEQAAHRLHLLADVFASSSRLFLQTVVGTAPEMGIDLGCGPGYTTRLLAEVTQSARIIGLDTSEYFLSLARRNTPAHLSFLCHDVTQTPFPTGPGDLIFCRMLLTHLREPLSVLEHWETQLRPGGFLLVEEVEWIQTEHSLLRRYLAIQAALLREQANELYIGPKLEQFQGNDRLKRRLSRVYPLTVSTTQAARMFALNLPSWKNHPFIQQQYGTIIEQVEHDLQALATNATSEGENVWGMRQLAYERK
jgi:trans-aconitate 2-methyltransferase